MLEYGNGMNRRTFLSRSSVGLGAAALSSLFGSCLSRNGQPPSGEALQGVLSQLHIAPKAKRVIYMFQSGAPSQYELFDYKPLLDKLRGQDLPESVRQGQRLTGMTAGKKAFLWVGSGDMTLNK